MRWLVVFAHPDSASYSAALCAAAVEGLQAGGAEVEVLDLHQLGFEPCMNDDEHRRYEEIAAAHPDPLVSAHIDALNAADALVFVYPTWWGGLPAILKGWMERVMLPGVAFRLDDSDQKVVGALQQLRRLVGITTYGGPRWRQRLVGDGGRTIVTRTVWLMCRRTTRRSWLALDRIEERSDAERDAFLVEVRDRMTRLATP